MVSCNNFSITVSYSIILGHYTSLLIQFIESPDDMLYVFSAIMYTEHDKILYPE